MKIVYTYLSVLFLLLIFPLGTRVYAEQNINENISNNIDYEYLCYSNDAKHFNRQKARITSFINDYINSVQEDEYLIKNPVNFSADDIDFQDNEKVKGIKIHGRYLSPKIDETYMNYQTRFSSQPYAWLTVLHKENTYVVLRIIPYSNKRSENPQTGDYVLDSKWIINVNAFTEENYTMGNQNSDGYLYNHIKSEMTENIYRVLQITNKTDVNVNVLFITLDDWKYADCALVFVEGKPEYVYFYTNFCLGVLDTEDDFSELLDEKLWNFYEDKLPIYNYEALLKELNNVVGGVHNPDTEFFP